MRLSHLVVVLAFLATGAFAQGAQVNFGGLENDPNAPIEVTSDQLEINQDEGWAVFTGEVIVGQGAMRLYAPWVKVFYTEGGGDIERVEAKDGVTLINGPEAAEGETAVYTLSDSMVVMDGNVLVTQGGSAVSGDRLRANMETGEARVEGRVRSLLTGDDDEDTPSDG